MTDEEFEARLVAALYRAAELDYMADMPSDEELDRIVQPAPKFQREMRVMVRNPRRFVRSRRRPVYLRVLRTAAAVIISLAILLGAAMAVSPTVRAAVIGIVSSWFSDRTEYKVPDGSVGTGWTFGYIPEGFELTDSSDTPVSISREYRNNDGVGLGIDISTGQEMVDNEHSTFYQTTINGRAADVYVSIDDKLYNSIIVMYDDSAGVMITCSATFNIDELIKVAENIHQEKPVGTDWTPGYIPEGFKLVNDMENEPQIYRVYENDEKTEQISIDIGAVKDSVNTGNTVFYQATINGRAADVYESNDPRFSNVIVMYDDPAGVFITLYSTISLDELIKVAENIHQ